MESLHRTGVLVGRPVMYRDIRLGVAVDVLLDGLVRRLVGLDVLCGDGATGDRELEPGPGLVVGNPDLRPAV